MSSGKLLIISGPSGSGKSYVSQLLRDNFGYYLSVSYATRKPRPNETDGVSYHFVSDEEYERIISEGGMLEHASYTAGKYGTPKSYVFEHLEKGENVILEIDIQGARQVRLICPHAVLFMLAPPDNETLKKRLLGRKDTSEEEMKKRLEIAHKELEGLGEYDYIIVNEDGKADLAAKTIDDIIAKDIPHSECMVSNNTDFMMRFFE